MTKVLVLQEKNPFESNSATANRWRTIIEGLAHHGCQVLLVITSGYYSKSERTKYGMNGDMSDRISYAYLNGQRNYNLTLRRINKYLKFGKLYRAVSRRRLTRLAMSFNPDYIIVPAVLGPMNYVCLEYDNLNTAKIVLEINEFDDIKDMHASNKLQRLQNAEFSRILKTVMFPKLDVCLTMTRELMNYYRSLPGLKPTIQFYHLPMTVDLSRFDSVSASTEKYICYTGSSSFYKDGVDILIKSFNIIADRFPDVELRIAAFWEIDGPKMMDLIKSSPYADRIKYLGALDRQSVADLISRSLLCALPRPDSRQARGGFPTKLGEYLASKKPVCITRVGEIPDFLTDGVSAYMAEPGDPMSFANALDRALSDYAFAKEVGLAGYRAAEKHFCMIEQMGKLHMYLNNLK